jgi:hypothetical protein
LEKKEKEQKRKLERGKKGALTRSEMDVKKDDKDQRLYPACE